MILQTSNCYAVPYYCTVSLVNAVKQQPRHNWPTWICCERLGVLLWYQRSMTSW